MTDLHISAYERRVETGDTVCVHCCSCEWKKTYEYIHKLSVSCLVDDLWFWLVAGRDGEMKGDEGLVVGLDGRFWFFFSAIDSYDFSNQTRARGVVRFVV